MDLNPPGADSYAFGVSGGQQVGAVRFNFFYRASLWTGSAASWVNLDPSFADSGSHAYGVHEGLQVGYANRPNGEHACLWSGTRESAIDLHDFLPASFRFSIAYGVWHDEHFTYVVGSGYESGVAVQALLWTRRNCYADCNLDSALNLADFGCFQTKFALGERYANCNGDSVLNLADSMCFQTKFALGCP